jgi:hypothetical protein
MAIFVNSGTHDDSMVDGINTPAAINAYWCTPADSFNSATHLKTTKKRGGVVLVKMIPNSVFKIDVKTDKEPIFANIYSGATQGFSFETLDFGAFSFGIDVRGKVMFKVKKRKIQEFQLKFYSDELDKPFGFYEEFIEYEYGNYFK